MSLQEASIHCSPCYGPPNRRQRKRAHKPSQRSGQNAPPGDAPTNGHAGMRRVRLTAMSYVHSCAPTDVRMYRTVLSHHGPDINSSTPRAPPARLIDASCSHLQSLDDAVQTVHTQCRGSPPARRQGRASHPPCGHQTRKRTHTCTRLESLRLVVMTTRNFIFFVCLPTRPTHLFT